MQKSLNFRTRGRGTDGRLLLGTWQGIYLWEHRRAPYARSVVVTVLGQP